MQTEPHQTETPKRVISLGRAAIAGLACLPLLLFALGFARFRAGGATLSGLVIAGERVGGLQPAELERRLTLRAQSLGREKLTLQLQTKQCRLTAEELGVSLSVADSRARALASGRSGGGVASAVSYLRSLLGPAELPGVLRLDGVRFDAALQRIEAELIDDPPFAGAISFDGKTPRAVAARSGRKIAADAARLSILDALSRTPRTAPLELEAVEVSPALSPAALEAARALAERALGGPVTLEYSGGKLVLQAEQLAPLLVSRAQADALVLFPDPSQVEAWLQPQRGAFESPARDAGFAVSVKDEVTVVPAEAGRSLAAQDLAQAWWNAAQRDERRGDLPLRQEPLPARSTEQAEQLGIRRLVATFTTRHPCCQARVENIHRIAALLDGLVVDPGQTVSVNAIVGPRTQKNGFVLAPGIEDGEMVDTLGGGVSQFATTFFNALFHAGYDIIERQPHSYWFPRYPMGHEATLSWPKPDIVFKNDTSAGMLVKTSFTPKSITVKLYGDMGGRKVTSSVSERREIVKPPVELLANRDIPADEEKVKDGGMIGWSVIASRSVMFADGTKKDERRKVTYKPKARRVEVHPCRIPDGEPGATGEPCPEPEDVAESETAPAAQDDAGHSRSR